MAKVTKKKTIKKKRKARAEAAGARTEVKTDVFYDEEEDLNKTDENIPSEEDESEEDERKRQKLLEAISSLGGQRRKTLGERSEAAVQMSEFTVNADGERDKVDLSDLIGTMEKTPNVSNKTKRQLEHLKKGGVTVECPLSKQESERIQRDVAFQKAATEVSQWKGVIKQNRRAPQLVFPLNQEPSGPKPMERVVSGWKASTPLETEIFALLSANKQPVNDPVLTPVEEEALKAMSLEEAQVRRAELQKARALQSYYEAKARREAKIKSKAYHKVQNRAKRRDFLKKFENMVASDPAAALEELRKIEAARIQERMSLKHQNSGKWAKSKALMAKYDEGARRAMQQQLEVNKELTQKVVTSLNPQEDEEEEEEEGSGDAEVLPDFVNDAEQALDYSNPWMRGKLTEEPTETKTDEPMDEGGAGAVKKTVEEEEEEEDVEETEEEVLLRQFDQRRKRRQAQEVDLLPEITADGDDDEERAEEEEQKEGEELSEFTSIFREIADGRREAAAAAAGQLDSSAALDEGLMRIRTLEDVELLSQEVGQEAEESVQAPPPEKPAQKVDKKRKRGIELKEVLTKKTEVIKAALAPTVEDAEDGDEDLDQRGLIREAFAGDDVIADFLKDKRSREETGKPKPVNLALPGWGEWAGLGLKPSKRKRRRFAVKTAPPPPRKDRHLPSVIISEKRNGALSACQVNSLPFPFQSHAQFESTIRAPTGRTWNTERTFHKLIQPRVVTQLGGIIEPMAREELLKDKKQQSATRDTFIKKY
ncbi:U3 small nucleolar RNA-associated protein 14 homolog A [Antennarius striatus]|uniref:U3 small nucleolar RNA-associated protein 14 homolog A n=1 Tax=Antennarius striatus TaxID=241820 RepID=UPI0035B2E1B1